MIGLRRIPEKNRARTIELWLGGSRYREISSKLEISLGAINCIINNVRKRAPDLDELRKLNLKLKKQDSSVQDTLRGARILDKVNQLGISLNRLETLLRILTKIASERESDEESFVNASLGLMRLESEFKKSYTEIVEDFEAKQTLIKHIELRAKKLREEIQKLGAEKRELHGTLNRAVKELKRALGTKKRLDKLSLDELATLAEHAEREGSLDNRIIERQNELESLKRRIAFLRKNASSIEKIDMLLGMRGSNFCCPYCGCLTLRILSRRECEDLLLRNAPLTVKCIYCGSATHYDLIKMLLAISLQILS